MSRLLPRARRVPTRPPPQVWRPDWYSFDRHRSDWLVLSGREMEGGLELGGSHSLALLHAAEGKAHTLGCANVGRCVDLRTLARARGKYPAEARDGLAVLVVARAPASPSTRVEETRFPDARRGAASTSRHRETRYAPTLELPHKASAVRKGDWAAKALSRAQVE